MSIIENDRGRVENFLSPAVRGKRAQLAEFGATISQLQAKVEQLEQKSELAETGLGSGAVVVPMEVPQTSRGGDLSRFFPRSEAG